MESSVTAGGFTHSTFRKILLISSGGICFLFFDSTKCGHGLENPVPLEGIVQANVAVFKFVSSCKLGFVFVFDE